MSKECKKCGYLRKPDESCPEYECPNCGAIYAKVEAALVKNEKDESEIINTRTNKLAEIKEPKLSALQTANIYIGLVLILSRHIPTAWILKKTVGGMYGNFFREFSPAVYHFTNICLAYSVTGLIVYIILKKLNVLERLEVRYASTALFTIGNSIIILYLIIRVFSSTMPGGGPPMVVSAYGYYPVLIARTLLYIAAIRLLIGIHPRPLVARNA